MSDDIERQAIKLFEDDSRAWTGKTWDWNIASDEVKERYRKNAREATLPPSPDDVFPGENPWNTPPKGFR